MNKRMNLIMKAEKYSNQNWIYSFIKDVRTVQLKSSNTVAGWNYYLHIGYIDVSKRQVQYINSFYLPREDGEQIIKLIKQVMNVKIRS